MKKYEVILTESEMRKLNEVRRDIRAKRLVVDDGDMEDEDGFITVDRINKSNYKKYIGKKVNVKGSVFLNYLNLGKLPITFGTVGGSFDCSDNDLTSLKGCPRTIGKNFYCSANDLTSLEGCPSEVNGNFDCSYNDLTSLEGCPSEVGRDFDCRNNKDDFRKAEIKRLCKVGGDILDTDIF